MEFAGHSFNAFEGAQMPLIVPSHGPTALAPADPPAIEKIVCGSESCVYRPGDWVILRGQGRTIIGQVIKLMADKDSHLLQVCQYLLPEETQHPAAETFWPNEIFKTRDLTYHLCNEVISRCFVLHISQYLQGRPKGHLWSQDTPLFLCERRYSLEDPLHPFQPIVRWKDISPNEMQYFEQPMTLDRLSSPFLRGAVGPGRLLSDIEVAILTAQQNNPSHFEVPNMNGRPYGPPIQYSDAGSPDKADHRQKRQRTQSHPQYLTYQQPSALLNGVQPANGRPLEPEFTAFDAAASLTPMPQLQAPPLAGPSVPKQLPASQFAATEGMPPMNPTNEYVGKPGKPPYSYASLIAQAIWNKPDQRCRLEEIYDFVSTAYPWYQTTTTSWQNMLRHNLSLRPCFVKVARTGGVGKGNWWTLDLEKEPGGFDGLSFGSRRVVAAGNRQLAAVAAAQGKPPPYKTGSRRPSQAGSETAEAADVVQNTSSDAAVPELPMQELQTNAGPVYQGPQQPLSHQPAPRPMTLARPGTAPSPTRSSDSERFESSPPRQNESTSPLLGSFSSATSADTAAAAVGAATSAATDGVHKSEFYGQLGYVPFMNNSRPRSSQTTSHEREPMPTSEPEPQQAEGTGSGNGGRQGNLDLMASVCQLISHNGTQEQTVQ